MVQPARPFVLLKPLSLERNLIQEENGKNFTFSKLVSNYIGVLHKICLDLLDLGQNVTEGAKIYSTCNHSNFDVT